MKVDGFYLLDGNIIGTVTDLDPDKWFGKVMLDACGEWCAEYGYLDPKAIVLDKDGNTYEDPKGGRDGSRGTLLEPDGNPIVRVSTFDD